MPSKIMAIVAHPGDALFTMGATVAQHIHNGGGGVFVSLSLGEKGAPKNISVAEYGAMQRTATEKAAKMLGAEAVLLTYPDAEIPLNDQIVFAVCDLIREHKPAIMVTHWSGSWHKDHQNCHMIVRDAIFYAGLGTIARALPPHDPGKTFYADNWEDATNFQPDTYLDITPVCEKWLEACDLYPMWRGQTGFFRYNDYYRSLAVMRGCLSGFKYAVALMTDPNQRLYKVRSLG
jgi:LmbE family N-acetylglucosaminyl deacetylase